jgi:predicted NAD-dependent protein-ADP-ribosyltransferase YbiA (DUF1768 family)
MLPNPSQQRIVAHTKTKEIIDEFNLIYEKNKTSNIIKALEEALYIKFSTNKELTDELLSTGNAKIIYICDDPKFEIVGELLENVRYRLGSQLVANQQASNKKQKDKHVYDVYMAYLLLRSDINRGIDIKIYENSDIQTIIKQHEKIVTKIKTPKLSEDVVLQMYDNGKFDALLLSLIDDPSNFAKKIRDEYLEELKINIGKARRNIVFDMYMDYKLRKNYPSLSAGEYEIAKNQQLQKLDTTMIINLKKQVYDAYVAGNLSESLSEAIDDKLKDYKDITTEPVKVSRKSESDKLDKLMRDPQIAPWDPKYLTSTISSPYKVPPPIEIFEQAAIARGNIGVVVEEPRSEINVYHDIGSNNQYNGFSILAYTGMLNINSRKYPTVYHYVITQLLSVLFDTKKKLIGIVNAYSMIVIGDDFSSPENYVSILNLSPLYTQQEDESYRAHMRENAKIAITEKFKNNKMKRVLRSTGDSYLVFISPNPILGNGLDKSGENVTGELLMEIREKTKNEPLEVEYITMKNLMTYIRENLFIQEWIDERTIDICHTVYAIYTYMSDENIKYVDILNRVLNIYGCKFNEVAIEMDIPKFFRATLQRCKGYNNLTKECNATLWKYVTSILKHVISTAGNMTDSSFENLIVSSRDKLSNSVCMKNSYACIMNAIVNICIDITSIVRFFNKKSTITPSMIDLVTVVLFNEPIVVTSKTEPSDEVKQIIMDQFNGMIPVDMITYVHNVALTIQDYSGMSEEQKSNRITFFSMNR